MLHVGDAYYLRAELSTAEHPIAALAAQMADDDSLRRESLRHLARLVDEHASDIEILGYHDFTEFPSQAAPMRSR